MFFGKSVTDSDINKWSEIWARSMLPNQISGCEGPGLARSIERISGQLAVKDGKDAPIANLANDLEVSDWVQRRDWLD